MRSSDKLIWSPLLSSSSSSGGADGLVVRALARARMALACLR